MHDKSLGLLLQGRVQRWRQARQALWAAPSPSALPQISALRPLMPVPPSGSTSAVRRDPHSGQGVECAERASSAAAAAAAAPGSGGRRVGFQRSRGRVAVRRRASAKVSGAAAEAGADEDDDEDDVAAAAIGPVPLGNFGVCVSICRGRFFAFFVSVIRFRPESAESKRAPSGSISACRASFSTSREISAANSLHTDSQIGCTDDKISCLHLGT